MPSTEKCVLVTDTLSTIIDSRLGWTYEGGEGFMNLGIAEDEEVRIWRPMEVPDTQAIRAKVAELEGLGFRTKISYVNK